MSRVCEVTGAGPQFGNNVPWSHKKTKRRWNVNLQKRRYVLPGEGRTITLRLSAKGIKTIDRQGIEKVVARLRREGKKI